MPQIHSKFKNQFRFLNDNYRKELPANMQKLIQEKEAQKEIEMPPIIEDLCKILLIICKFCLLWYL